MVYFYKNKFSCIQNFINIFATFYINSLINIQIFYLVISRYLWLIPVVKSYVYMYMLLLMSCCMSRCLKQFIRTSHVVDQLPVKLFLLLFFILHVRYNFFTNKQVFYFISQVNQREQNCISYDIVPPANHTDILLDLSEHPTLISLFEHYMAHVCYSKRKKKFKKS
jgi:hypothetical protein